MPSRPQIGQPSKTGTIVDDLSPSLEVVNQVFVFQPGLISFEVAKPGGATVIVEVISASNPVVPVGETVEVTTVVI